MYTVSSFLTAAAVVSSNDGGPPPLVLVVLVEAMYRSSCSSFCFVLFAQAHRARRPYFDRKARLHRYCAAPIIWRRQACVTGEKEGGEARGGGGLGLEIQKIPGQDDQHNLHIIMASTAVQAFPPTCKFSGDRQETPGGNTHARNTCLVQATAAAAAAVEWPSDMIRFFSAPPI